MRTWRQIVASFCLLAAGMMLGGVLNSPRAALGEVRRTPAPSAFQSGGERSVPILRDIAATLQQMDGRLARLETLAKQMQKPLR